MSNSKRLKRRLRRLWFESHRCRCCGQPTILPEAFLEERNGRMVIRGKPPLNLATVQHYDSRLSAHRGTAHWEKRTTLYCWECNDRENEIVQTGTPKVTRRIRSKLGHIKKRAKQEKCSANGTTS